MVVITGYLARRSIQEVQRVNRSDYNLYMANVLSLGKLTTHDTSWARFRHDTAAHPTKLPLPQWVLLSRGTTKTRREPATDTLPGSAAAVLRCGWCCCAPFLLMLLLQRAVCRGCKGQHDHQHHQLPHPQQQCG